MRTQVRIPSIYKNAGYSQMYTSSSAGEGLSEARGLLEFEPIQKTQQVPDAVRGHLSRE